jgi:hypothetical protein
MMKLKGSAYVKLLASWEILNERSALVFKRKHVTPSAILFLGGDSA